MKEAVKPLTVKLPVSQADHLAELAKKRRVSTDVIARQAIRRYLAVEALDRIQDRLAPLAKKLGIKTDEDVYRQLAYIRLGIRTPAYCVNTSKGVA